jgi:hypothetical protein
MENKRVVSTQEIVCAFSPPNPECLCPSRNEHDAEQEHRKKKPRMSTHYMREASSLRNAIRTVSIMD